MDLQPLTGVLIDHGQTTQPSAVHGLVVDEVVAPDVVRILGTGRESGAYPSTRRFFALRTTCSPSRLRSSRTLSRPTRHPSPLSRAYTLR